MEARDTFLHRFLTAGRNYVIPVYQRNYDWKKEHCEKLLQDIIKASKENFPEYFLGSMVTVLKDPSNYSEYFIIDGQQRLTTITLLLLAIYHNDSDIAKGTKSNIDNLLFRNVADQNRRLILKQIQKDDQYLSKIINNDPTHSDDSNISNNYSLFRNAISENPEMIIDIMKGFNKLKIVDIELTQNDQPQLVFETLNATGKELSEADKIRNYILMYKDQERLYNNYWSKIEENCLQYRDSNSVSNFMKAFLTIELDITQSIRDNMVYKIFKKYLEDKDNEKVLVLMLQYSKCYNAILTQKHGENSSVSKTIFHISELETTIFNPLILCILKLEMDKKLSTENATYMIGLLENYLVRRLICSVPSNALNKIVVALIRLTIKNSEKDIINLFEEFLYTRKLAARFPKDEEVKENFTTRELYHRYGRFLLSLLETTHNKEQTNLENISIEHIMPQTLSSDWKDYLGEEYSDIHENYLHTIGNLTLTGYNSELGNKSMREKQPMLADSNFRYLNEDFNNPDIVWNKDTILKRTSRIADAILNIYPNLTVEIDTSQIDADMIEYELDANNDFSSSHIVKYDYNGITYEVEDQQWSTFIVKIGVQLYQDNPVAFHQYIIENPFFQNKVKYGGKFKYATKTINVNDRTLCFNTKNDTNTKINFLIKMFEALSLDTEDISLFIVADK